MHRDTIFIHDLKVHTIIGCLPSEKLQPQLLILNIDMQKNFSKVVEKDDILLTVDYAVVVNEIRDYIKHHHFSLIETLADHLAQHLLHCFAIESIVIKIQKPEAIPDLPNVGVILSRNAQSH